MKASPNKMMESLITKSERAQLKKSIRQRNILNMDIIMKKVMQFKTTLSSIDVVVNIFVALAVISGIIVTISQPIIGISLLIGSGCFWLAKICGFGISYTIIQIAENTSPENINTSSSINMAEAIHKNKASEFIQIYVKNQNEYGKNPTLKKVFDNLVEDIMLESTSNIEYSIRLMLTKN